MEGLIDMYEELLSDPNEIVGDMTFDEYCEWVDLGTLEDWIACLKVFKEKGMHEAYIRILEHRINQQHDVR